MHHPYTFGKVYECRRDELLREAHQWEHSKALRAARPAIPRHSTLMQSLRQVLRWMAVRGHIRLSDG